MNENQVKETINVVLAVVFLGLLIALGPLLFIWALNTLFPVLEIDYNLSTWAAAFIISATLTSKVNSKK